ncbi:unnamed protein product [Anisakis simplex]|uniref:KRFB protein n=1 Tax=Anisakis simplex TaxID=6269 RepID=A0A0M3K7V3_ANISI|nr:unnamed protein product [Anisakis simplex]
MGCCTGAAMAQCCCKPQMCLPKIQLPRPPTMCCCCCCPMGAPQIPSGSCSSMSCGGSSYPGGYAMPPSGGSGYALPSSGGYSLPMGGGGYPTGGMIPSGGGYPTGGIISSGGGYMG